MSEPTPAEDWATIRLNLNLVNEHITPLLIVYKKDFGAVAMLDDARVRINSVLAACDRLAAQNVKKTLSDGHTLNQFINDQYKDVDPRCLPVIDKMHAEAAGVGPNVESAKGEADDPLKAQGEEEAK